MYAPDSASPVCLEGETVCNNTCANLQASDQYCGNCNTQCNHLEGCLNGTCQRKNSSCANILAFDPSAQTGAYYNGNDGQTMYCDVTARRQIEIGIGLHTASFAGYTGMRAGDFADAVIQQAFIAIYNKDGGFKTLAAWTPQYCCFHTSTGGDLTLLFGGSVAFMFASTSQFQCNSTLSYNGWYPVGRTSAVSGIAQPPMPTNYFQTYPVTEVQNCLIGANPNFFIKASTF